MSTAVATNPSKNGQASGETLPALPPPRLPYHPAVEQRFGVTRAQWKALVEAIFPLATNTDSIILALSYCKARNLDPFKKNIHIVPIWNSQLKKMVDTIWPGIGELRTTAFRTRQYAGRGDTVFGEDVTEKIGSANITYPAWAQVTLYRMVDGERVAFAGPRVYWKETYSTAKRDDPTPNSMWLRRPRGQLDKCAEAAALRAAFPEELGDERTDDEIGVLSDQQLNSKQEQADHGMTGLESRLGLTEQPTEVAAERVDDEGEIHFTDVNPFDPPAEAADLGSFAEPEKPNAYGKGKK